MASDIERMAKRIEQLEEQARVSDTRFSSIDDRFEKMVSWQLKATVLFGRLEEIHETLKQLVEMKWTINNLSERIDELEESRW